MTKSSFLKTFFFALSIVFVISCDRDFNEVGGDIIEDDIHHNNMERYYASVVAYDRPTGAVQANNLTVNSLGVYQNSVFGKTIAHFVTQVQLASENPTLTNPVVDSVYLYVPYHSTAESIDYESGETIYSIDSIYGTTDNQFRLKIYRNGYYLRSSDPGTPLSEGQKYYTDELSLVEGVKGEMLVDTDFSYSAEEVVREIVNGDGETEVKERFAPGMYFYLDKDYFQNTIINAPVGKLLNNNVFKDYFRGLYFKAEQIGTQAIMGMPKFNQGVITIIYKDDKLDVNGDPVLDENGVVERISKTLNLNLTGNTINFFENTYSDSFNTAITSSDLPENPADPYTGDVNLYIKGGQGSVAFIDISDADLATLKTDRVLINEANLTFTLNEAVMATVKQPLRVYLYDVRNKRPVYDYYYDTSTSGTNRKNDKPIFGGILKEKDGKKVYKIRLTNHINNIINNDSTNVRLGLVVTEDIALTGNAALKIPLTVGTADVKTIPASSVMHPFGTVIYGSNSSVAEDRRLKLEIFYTKPN